MNIYKILIVITLIYSTSFLAASEELIGRVVLQAHNGRYVFAWPAVPGSPIYANSAPGQGDQWDVWRFFDLFLVEKGDFIKSIEDKLKAVEEENLLLNSRINDLELQIKNLKKDIDW